MLGDKKSNAVEEWAQLFAHVTRNSTPTLTIVWSRFSHLHGFVRQRFWQQQSWRLNTSGCCGFFTVRCDQTTSPCVRFWCEWRRRWFTAAILNGHNRWIGWWREIGCAVGVYNCSCAVWYGKIWLPSPAWMMPFALSVIFDYSAIFGCTKAGILQFCFFWIKCNR